MMRDMDAKRRTLSAHVGEALRRLRDEHGITQDQVARMSHVGGLTWGRSSVASLEAGNRQLSAEEFLMLSPILENLIGRPVALTELVPRDVLIDFGSNTPVMGMVLHQVIRSSGLATREVTREEWADAWSRETMPPATTGTVHSALPALTASAAGELQITGAAHPSHPAGDIGDAERKAAQKFGVAAEVVRDTASQLWGHSLTEERDRRVDQYTTAEVPTRSRQARRGHVTRTLLAEIEHVLASAKGSGVGRGKARGRVEETQGQRKRGR